MTRKSKNIYLSEFSQQVLGNSLQYIVQTDSYLRQPCYSSRANSQYFFIVERMDAQTLAHCRIIQGEFPELVFNLLTTDELKNYPAHAKWAFQFASIVYTQSGNALEVQLTKDQLHVALSQSIVGVGHIARLYYLRDLDVKTHIWAVRQFGWALRCTEFGIVKLWAYISQDSYELPHEEGQITTHLDWLVACNQNWPQCEAELLQSVDAYKEASLRLNEIIQFYAQRFASSTNQYSAYTESDSNEYDAKRFDFISDFRQKMVEIFGSKLRLFYLSGSAARDDRHQNSDIDSIAIFDQIDVDTLQKMREIQSGFNNISVYTLSFAEFLIYPAFRYYTMTLGTKKMLGNISFITQLTQSSLQQSILNNVYTILQIARAYLINGECGPRALHLLKLMTKLADHGVLRLIYQIREGNYPDKKETVRDYFKDTLSAVDIMDTLLNINSKMDVVRDAVSIGNLDLLIQGFKKLDKFAEQILIETTQPSWLRIQFDANSK